MLRTPLSLLVAVLALAASAVGCGGAASSGDADPGRAVPASALLYAEMTLRPDGDVEAGARAALGKILDSDDPGAELRESLDELIAREDSDPPTATFENDVDPWLGDRAALWAAQPAAGRDEDAFGAVVAVRDAEAANEFLRREQAGSEKKTYRGVEYLFEAGSDETAYAVTEDLMLVGAESEFKQMVDVLAGEGSPLVEAKGYEAAIEPLTDERLGHAYLDLPRLVDAALAADPSAAAFKQFLPLDRIPAVALALLADGDRVAIESAARSEGGLLGIPGLGAGGSSPLLGELPGDAWAAFAVPDLGKTSAGLIDSIAGGLGSVAIAAQIREATGLDIRADVLDWIGDVAFFVRGDSADDLDGGLVIDVVDDAKAASAFGKLAVLVAGGSRPEPVELPGAESAFRLSVEGMPQPVFMARAPGKVVVALGQPAAADALTPATKLAESELFEQAKEALGGDFEPSLIVSAPTALTLAETAHPDRGAKFAGAKRYLDALSVLVAGAEQDGDFTRSRLSAGLK